jgi:hypothetical protein
MTHKTRADDEADTVTDTSSNGGFCVRVLCSGTWEVFQSLAIHKYLHTPLPCVIISPTCDGVGRINRTFLINTPCQLWRYSPNKNLQTFHVWKIIKWQFFHGVRSTSYPKAGRPVRERQNNQKISYIVGKEHTYKTYITILLFRLK